MLKTLINNLKGNLIFYILVFVLGYNVDKIFPYSYFVISKEVNIVDVFSIFTTVFLALYISRIIEMQKDQKKYEKEIVFNKINELCRVISCLKELIHKNNVDLGTLNYHIKMSFTLTKFINQILQNYNIYNSPAYMESVLNEIRKVRGILTTTPIDSKSVDINISSNIVTYSSAIINSSFQKLSNIENLVTEWQLEINKA